MRVEWLTSGCVTGHKGQSIVYFKAQVAHAVRSGWILLWLIHSRVSWAPDTFDVIRISLNQIIYIHKKNRFLLTFSLECIVINYTHSISEIYGLYPSSMCVFEFFQYFLRDRWHAWSLESVSSLLPYTHTSHCEFFHVSNVLTFLKWMNSIFKMKT